MSVITGSKKILLFLPIGIFLFLIYSCETGQSQTNVLIATVGKEIITVVDLDQTVNNIPLPHRYEYKSEQALNDLVQSMIDWKLMAKEAIKLSLDKEPDTKAQLETMKDKPASLADQLLASAYINRKQSELREIPERDMRHYYTTHQEEFIIPERVKIERVIYKSEQNAKAAREAMKQGMGFEEFMEANPTFRRKVNTLWLGKSGKDSVMENVAFNLSEGEVSHVFETKAGYCLLRVAEKTPAAMRSFSEVQAGIKARLEVQKQRALLDQIKEDLRKNVSITINQPVLEAYLLKEQAPKKNPHE